MATMSARCCRSRTETWPFFRTVLSNMAQVLAKSDMGLAARYAELAGDTRLRERVFRMIRAEHERTIRMHGLVTGQDDLLADNPALASPGSTGSRTSNRSTTCKWNCCGAIAPARMTTSFSVASRSR